MKRNYTPLPGFGLTLTASLIYLTFIMFIPLAFLIWQGIRLDWSLATLIDEGVLSACRLTFYTSFIAALINSIFGLILSWIIVRYDFYGKRLLDMMVDLPLALPTAIAGIALVNIYGKDGWGGNILNYFGIEVAYTSLGIIVALIFVGIPFTVRCLEPVLQEAKQEMEEAASLLGASRWQIFYKIIFPYILPAFLTGFTLAFAKGLGEYGAVIFIASNIPYVSEVISLVIVSKLEQYDYQSAIQIALLMLGTSFILLLILNYIQQKFIYTN